MSIDELSREATDEFLSQTDLLNLFLADFKTFYRGLSSKLYEYQTVGKLIIYSSKVTQGICRELASIGAIGTKIKNLLEINK